MAKVIIVYIILMVCILVYSQNSFAVTLSGNSYIVSVPVLERIGNTEISTSTSYKLKANTSQSSIGIDTSDNSFFGGDWWRQKFEFEKWREVY